METRDKVRILLVNPMGDILLMRLEDTTSRDPSRPEVDISRRWITVGGGIEPGETFAEAARREAHEETGVSDIEIGPVLEQREVVYEISGKPVLFRETYMAASTGSWEHDYSGWTEQERTMVQEMRWWSLQEIRATKEIVFPYHLAELLPRALAAMAGPVS